MTEAIIKNKIIAILRNVPLSRVRDTAAALYEGGIRLMEVTFNQSGDLSQTAAAIEEINREFEGKVLVGAGTVLTEEQLYMAEKSGAKFIISPNVNCKIIAETKRLGLISIPGAMTPSEAVQAHGAGADFVKLFPIECLGAGYLKSVCSPLTHINFIAVGGVNDKNMLEFFKAGACAVGVGGNLVNLKHINEGNYMQLTETVLLYTRQL